MQTFLPYADFDESMRVLDQPRLGKQRVETLQVLRSLLLPNYGWQTHPVSRMWRGYLPALSAYGMASVREWTARGHADATGPLMREFAPDVADLPQSELAARGLLPAWVDDEAVHISHRSNLIRKDPEFYTPRFPGTPVDLDYVWPEAGTRDDVPVSDSPVVVVRAASPGQLHHWRETDIVAVGEKSPRGRDTPAWRAQVTAFVDEAVPGARVGVLVGNDAVVHQVEIDGDLGTRVTEEGEAFLTRPAAFVGTWARTDFVVPAVLQDPRAVFTAYLREG